MTAINAACGCMPTITPTPVQQSPVQQAPGGPAPIGPPLNPATPAPGNAIIDAFNRQYDIKLDFNPAMPNVAAAVSDAGKIVAVRTQRVGDIGAAIASTRQAGTTVSVLADMRYELESGSLPLLSGLVDAIKGVQQHLQPPDAAGIVEGAKRVSVTGGLQLSVLAQAYTTGAVRAGTITQAQADQALTQLREVDALQPIFNDRAKLAGAQLLRAADVTFAGAPGSGTVPNPQLQAQLEAQVPELAAIRAEQKAAIDKAAAALRSIGVTV